MTDSQRLLADYVRNGSEEAFRELVTCYLALVYSTAIRLVGGNTHLAEDVAQTVFVDLARKARTLPNDVMLGGWLHRDTCFVASKTMRSERRRQSRERLAVEMNSFQDQSEPALTQVAPILDEAINQLGAGDRTAILLRFFEQRDFRSVGEALGSNEDAARMRVTRSLEKLHSLLKHRGVTLSVAALGTVLTAEAVTAAPVGLAVTISSVALASAATGAGLGVIEVVTMTKLKAGIIGAIVVASVATPLVIQHQVAVRLHAENQLLRQQVDQLARLTAENQRLSKLVAKRSLAPHLPAPPMTVTTAPGVSPTDDLQPTNRIVQLMNKPAKLTTEQVESYLKGNRRTAASLLAAYRTTGNPALLQEAMEKYANDPQVDFEAVFKKDASAEERRQWLDTFKQSAPNNALANYLSALDYFKARQTDQAVQEFTAASDKPQFQDYIPDSCQDDEEAYLAAGYSVAEAKALAISMGWSMHEELKQLAQSAQDMIDLANSYRQTGDEASARAALEMVANLGQRYADIPAGRPLITEAVGLKIERAALRAMDPDSSYGSNGQTVQEQLDQLNRAITEVGQLAGLWSENDGLMTKISNQDWINYCDRLKAFGEKTAMRWLADKYGQK